MAITVKVTAADINWLIACWNHNLLRYATSAVVFKDDEAAWRTCQGHTNFLGTVACEVHNFNTGWITIHYCRIWIAKVEQACERNDFDSHLPLATCAPALLTNIAIAPERVAIEIDRHTVVAITSVIAGSYRQAMHLGSNCRNSLPFRPTGSRQRFVQVRRTALRTPVHRPTPAARLHQRDPQRVRVRMK